MRFLRLPEIPVLVKEPNRNQGAIAAGCSTGAFTGFPDPEERALFHPAFQACICSVFFFVDPSWTAGLKQHITLFFRVFTGRACPGISDLAGTVALF
jgi:hypothetical protein